MVVMTGMGCWERGVEMWCLYSSSIDVLMGLASKLWFRHWRLARSLDVTCGLLWQLPWWSLVILATGVSPRAPQITGQRKQGSSSLRAPSRGFRSGRDMQPRGIDVDVQPTVRICVSQTKETSKSLHLASKQPPPTSSSLIKLWLHPSAARMSSVHSIVLLPFVCKRSSSPDC
jgi:hypothetical protein